MGGYGTMVAKQRRQIEECCQVQSISEYISETKSEVGLGQSMEVETEIQLERNNEVVGGVGEYMEYLLDRVCPEL